MSQNSSRYSELDSESIQISANLHRFRVKPGMTGTVSHVTRSAQNINHIKDNTANSATKYITRSYIYVASFSCIIFL